MRRYKVLGFRRRRLGITDYERRLKLLKSKKLRVVIRKSNKYIQLQLVEYKPDGDNVILSVGSKVLKKLGWKHSCKNLPAAYLTGLYVGKVVKEKKISDAVVDCGLYPTIKGSVLFAALKGIIDGGLKVQNSKDIFPDDKRIMGEGCKDKDNIKKDFENMLIKVK